MLGTTNPPLLWVQPQLDGHRTTTVVYRIKKWADKMRTAILGSLGPHSRKNHTHHKTRKQGTTKREHNHGTIFWHCKTSHNTGGSSNKNVYRQTMQIHSRTQSWLTNTHLPSTECSVWVSYLHWITR
jgi:hypothetical protein